MAINPIGQYRLPYAGDAPADGTLSKTPSPLDVLLHTMHRKWQVGDFDGAAALARVAAPYLHARLSMARPSAGLRTMTDAEIDGLCDTDDAGSSTAGGGSAGASAAAGDPEATD